MSVVTDMVARLAAAGVSAEGIAIAVEAVGTIEGELQERKAQGKERTAKWRARRHGDVTVTQSVTSHLRSPDKERSPIPPKEINPTLFGRVSSNDETLVNGQPLTCEMHSKKRQEELARLREFAEGWNNLAGELRLPQIEEIGSGSMRERHALARLRQMPTTDFLWPFIRGSPYLRGEVNGFRCTFDWIINAANFEKIRDGNYADRQERPREINFLARR
jgi:hypothetical protein